MTLSTSNFPRIFDSVPRYKPTNKDNFFFFRTNENNYQETLSLLNKIPKQGNTVIGVSGLFSLDLLAARMSAPKPSKKKINTFIVIDKSPIVKRFWKSISRIITGNLEKEPPSRLEVIEKIKHLIRSQKIDFFEEISKRGLSPTEAAASRLKGFDTDIANETSFASSDQTFKRIQIIFRNGRFQFLQVNMCTPESLSQLGKVLKAHHLSVDTLYVSNIRDWAVTAKREIEYDESIRVIRGEKTIVVDSTRFMLIKPVEGIIEGDTPLVEIELEKSGLLQQVHKPNYLD